MWLRLWRHTLFLVGKPWTLVQRWMSLETLLLWSFVRRSLGVKWRTPIFTLSAVVRRATNGGKLLHVSVPGRSKFWASLLLVEMFLCRWFSIAIVKLLLSGMTRWPPTPMGFLLPSHRSPGVPVWSPFVLRWSPRVFLGPPTHPILGRWSPLLTWIPQPTFLSPVHIRVVVCLVKPRAFILKVHPVPVWLLSLPAEGVRGQVTTGSEVPVWR